MKVYIEGADRNSLSSIRKLTPEDEKKILFRMLKDYVKEDDKNLSPKELVRKYVDELKELCEFDKDTKETFGYVNTWWVFGEVAKEINYKIFMAEVENIGYKRTKKGEKPMPNKLYRTGIVKYDDGTEREDILLSDEDGIYEAVLDYIRKIQWD